MYFEGIWRGQNVHQLIETPRHINKRVNLFYLPEEFYTTEQEILNVSICLFQPSGTIKITGSYQNSWKFF